MCREKFYYVAVTPDKYEFPLFVADNYKELSNWSGVSVSCLKMAVHRGSVDKKLNCKYIRVLKEPDIVQEPLSLELEFSIRFGG